MELPFYCREDCSSTETDGKDTADQDEADPERLCKRHRVERGGVKRSWRLNEKPGAITNRRTGHNGDRAVTGEEIH
jgi:hypothetical protein